MAGGIIIQFFVSNNIPSFVINRVSGRSFISSSKKLDTSISPRDFFTDDSCIPVVEYVSVREIFLSSIDIFTILSLFNISKSLIS
jgi:hypothetical protein